MNTARQISLFFMAGLLLGGCSKKEEVNPPSTDTEYFVINNVQGNGSLTGNLSTFKKPENIFVSEAFWSNEGIGDVVISGEKIYIARMVTPVIDIITLNGLQTLNAVGYAKAPTGNFYRHMEIVGDRIVISDRAFITSATSGDASFLKIIHLDNLAQVDSVPIITNAAIWALAVANNKIFVSAGSQQQSIFVIDGNSNAQLGEIKLATRCSAMVVDKDNNILAFTGTKLLTISSTTLAPIKEKDMGSSQLNLKNQSFASTANTSHALDRANNILYYLSNAAQPASAPFLINAYNLNTDVTTLLNPNYISAETISFDQENRLILLGDANSSGGGVVKILDTKGSLVSEFSLKNIPTKILIQP